MTIICSGSLAFDRLMEHSGLFSDSLLADRLDMINVCFLVDKATRVCGGTAGNIAYNLQLLGEKPLIVGSLGDDPDGDDYYTRIKEWGLPLNGIKTQPGHLTANCNIVTDRKGNQLTFFHGGAGNELSGIDPKAALGDPNGEHLAIIAPGGAKDMIQMASYFRENDIKFIFDPGQQIPAFSGEELKEMLDGSYIFCCNEYEFELFKSLTALSTEDLFQHTQIVVVTKAEKGCELLVPGRGSQSVPAVTPYKVVNPTGAGDAFRAGLLLGLTNSYPLITACRLGSTVASFNVESAGTQDHSFTPTGVMARHATFFKESLDLG